MVYLSSDYLKNVLSAAGSNGNNGSGKGEADADADRKKTGAESVLEKHQERQKRAREQAEAQAQWFDLKENTSVYMTGLPDDVTEAEIAQVSRYVMHFACVLAKIPSHQGASHL